jgi:hypothetical protein
MLMAQELFIQKIHEKFVLKTCPVQVKVRESVTNFISKQ